MLKITRSRKNIDTIVRPGQVRTDGENLIVYISYDGDESTSGFRYTYLCTEEDEIEATSFKATEQKIIKTFPHVLQAELKVDY